MIDASLPLVDKPRYVRDLGPVDVAPLVQIVTDLPESFWSAADEMKENKFAVLKSTQHIVFRFTPGNLDPRNSYDTPFWMTWSRHLLPLMETVSTSFGMIKPTYSKAMFARLKANRSIAKHRDGPGSNLTSHKIHVPLITNPHVVFYVDEKPFLLAVGRAYELNNVSEHGVENSGDQDRIHFIFEVFDAALSEYGA